MLPGWRRALPGAGALGRQACRAAFAAASPALPAGRRPELTLVLADDATVRRLNRTHRGIDRPTAARYSFLLSIPAVGGAGMLELIHERAHLAAVGWTSVIVGIVVAFISGYASIWFLIRYLRTHTTAVFIYYRYALGALMLVLLATGYLKG
jgi:hypothetical protein